MEPRLGLWGPLTSPCSDFIGVWREPPAGKSPSTNTSPITGT
jgi:hypothetical protein